MKGLLLFVICLLTLGVNAQDKSPFARFGAVRAAHLRQSHYSIDSSAAAVVLADIGSASIVGNDKGWFAIKTRRHRVVHILNNEGLDEADIEIPLYAASGDEEKLGFVKGVTYNLDGNRIIESKLDRASIYHERINSNLALRKFSMPNVRAGSIIEYEYEVTSDYINNPDPWAFQGASPVLWSEFTLSVPQFFTYAFTKHGYTELPYQRKERMESFLVNDIRNINDQRILFNALVTDFRWVATNLPELKAEPFTSTLHNHIARLEFQLSAQNEPLVIKSFRSTWEEATAELLAAPSFGKELPDASWLKEELPVTAHYSDSFKRAEQLFASVRDRFTCTDYSEIYLSSSLKNSWRKRSGSVADINLLLAAALKAHGFRADPVILSTRDHGYALKDYPILTHFNYVIVRLVVGDSTVLLDAAHPLLGFGKLTTDVYNGHARMVNAEATPLQLAPDSFEEKKLTALVLHADASGWKGTVTRTPGYHESTILRENVRQHGIAALERELEATLKGDGLISEMRIDSLHRLEEVVSLKYQLNYVLDNSETIYLNPLFGEGYQKNPFAAAKRFYPVEMPYALDETLILHLAIPEGYEVDHLPEEVLAKFDDAGSASFEYRIAQNSAAISLRVRLQIRKTFFTPEEYSTLREFFKLIVAKEAEMIVLKKRK